MTVGSCLQVGQAFFGAYVLCFISIFQAVISLFCGLPFFVRGHGLSRMASAHRSRDFCLLLFSFLFSLFPASYRHIFQKVTNVKVSKITSSCE